LFNPATIERSVCTKPGKWATIYVCVSNIDVPLCLHTICRLDFGIVATVWYFCDSVVFFLFLLFNTAFGRWSIIAPHSIVICYSLTIIFTILNADVLIWYVSTCKPKTFFIEYFRNNEIIMIMMKRLESSCHFNNRSIYMYWWNDCSKINVHVYLYK
jgi:hypothetical protein